MNCEIVPVCKHHAIKPYIEAEVTLCVFLASKLYVTVRSASLRIPYHRTRAPVLNWVGDWIPSIWCSWWPEKKSTLARSLNHVPEAIWLWWLRENSLLLPVIETRSQSQSVKEIYFFACRKSKLGH